MTSFMERAVGVTLIGDASRRTLRGEHAGARVSLVLVRARAVVRTR